MKKRLVWIGGILLALLLAAYLIVPNWILAKPREALIEAVRQELAADWKSKAVALQERVRMAAKRFCGSRSKRRGTHSIRPLPAACWGTDGTG